MPDATLTHQDETGGLFADSLARQGYVLNYFRAHALNPENLAWFGNYLLPLLGPAGGRPSYTEREMVAGASGETQCTYCQHHHAVRAGTANGGQADALDYGRVTDFSARERALTELSVKFAHDPESVADEDVEGLRAIGADDRDIYAAVETAALFNTATAILTPVRASAGATCRD